MLEKKSTGATNGSVLFGLTTATIAVLLESKKFGMACAAAAVKTSAAQSDACAYEGSDPAAA